MSITLKAARINAGYDRKTASMHLGVSVDTLGNWEAGKTFPNVPQITAIEHLYSVKYADINFLPQNIGLTDKV